MMGSVQRKRFPRSPTLRMAAYIAEMQELVQEVRVSGSDRHSHLQTALRGSEEKFFTPLRLVGPPGLEPGTNRL